MRGTPWTRDEDACLDELLGAGMTYRQAAEAMGRTHDSVKYRACRNAVRVTHRDDLWASDALDILVSRYRTKGWTAKRIGQVVGKSAEAVYKKAAQLGLQQPQIDYKAKPKTLEQRARILSAQDLTITEIAEALGASKGWVWDQIKRSPVYHKQWKAREGGRRSEGQRARHAKEGMA